MRPAGVQRFLGVRHAGAPVHKALPVVMLVGSAVLPLETRLVVGHTVFLVVFRRNGVGQLIINVDIELVAPVFRIAV